MSSPFASLSMIPSDVTWMIPSEEEQMKNKTKWFIKGLVRQVAYNECHARIETRFSDPLPFKYCKSRIYKKGSSAFTKLAGIVLLKNKKNHVSFDDKIQVAMFCVNDPPVMLTI